MIIVLALILISAALYFLLSGISANKTNHQETYERQFEEIQSGELSDTDKITQIIHLFFNAKIHNYKFPDFDLSFFLDTENNSFEANKIINAAKLRAELNKRSGKKIITDKLTLTINEVSVTDNKATVKLDEQYDYLLKDVYQSSAYSIMCTVNLSKINNKWLITSIDSNDEFITDDMGGESFNPKLEAARILPKH